MRLRMRNMRTISRPIAVVAALLVCLSMAMVAQASGARAEKPPIFGAAVTLTDGHGHPGVGGEPSIAIDTTSKAGVNDEYIVSPNQHALWRSYDGGKTWSGPVVFDASGTAPGGDTDVAVSQQGHVIVDDLDVTHAWIQVSTDHGKSFNSGTATAFEDDRPWLATEGLTPSTSAITTSSLKYRSSAPPRTAARPSPSARKRSVIRMRRLSAPRTRSRRVLSSSTPRMGP